MMSTESYRPYSMICLCFQHCPVRYKSTYRTSAGDSVVNGWRAPQSWSPRDLLLWIASLVNKTERDLATTHIDFLTFSSHRVTIFRRTQRFVGFARWIGRCAMMHVVIFRPRDTKTRYRTSTGESNRSMCDDVCCDFQAKRYKNQISHIDRFATPLCGHAERLCACLLYTSPSPRD